MTAAGRGVQHNDTNGRGVMAEFHKVCRVGDLAEGEGKTVQVAGKLLAVFRHHDNYHVLDDTCPHMGASLSGGYLEDGVVTCPWHAWRFRLCDGTWADYPRIKIGCYQVRVVGDDVEVMVEAGPARPAGGAS